MPNRRFKPDGKQTGEIGECLVAMHYDLDLLPPANPKHDAITKDGKLVEIKSTHAHRVYFRSKPEYAIVIKLSGNGEFEECYNGPGYIIWDYFNTRIVKKCMEYPLTISIARELNKKVPSSERVSY